MKKPEDLKPDSALTAAAEAIGSTIGKIAVKTGLVKAAPRAAKKRVPRKKTPKAAVPTKRKAPRKKPVKTSARTNRKQ